MRKLKKVYTCALECMCGWTCLFVQMCFRVVRRNVHDSVYIRMCARVCACVYVCCAYLTRGRHRYERGGAHI